MTQNDKDKLEVIEALKEAEMEATNEKRIKDLQKDLEDSSKARNDRIDNWLIELFKHKGDN